MRLHCHRARLAVIATPLELDTRFTETPHAERLAQLAIWHTPRHLRNRAIEALKPFEDRFLDWQGRTILDMEDALKQAGAYRPLRPLLGAAGITGKTVEILRPAA